MLSQLTTSLAAARSRRELDRLSPRLLADIGRAEVAAPAPGRLAMVHALAPDLLGVLRDPPRPPAPPPPALPPVRPHAIRPLVARAA